MADPMVIQSRMFDLLVWLMPKVEGFPKSYRFTVTQRLMSAALDAQDALGEAQGSRGKIRRDALHTADRALIRLKTYLRLAHHWHWLTPGQYEHVSRLVMEIGRLLGGWMKSEAARVGGSRS